MPTTLPPPTAEHLTATGLYPRAQMQALGRELDALVADLHPAGLPKGTSRLSTEEADALIAGRVRVGVGVYAPGGMDLHSLGWLPAPSARQSAARIVAHLPGARVEDERAAGAAERAIMIQWGSRTPGWTPTAIPVTRGLTMLWREREQVWTASEVAEHLGIARGTWRSYVTRGDADAPRPLGTIGEVGADRRTRRVDVWDPQVVAAWRAARPGHGGRPPRRPDGE
jgi:hypothetical protein